MEHIVQFAIGIDDEAIRQRVVESAYNDVVKQLVAEAKKETGLSNPRYYQRQTWQEFIDHALRNYLEENKEIIINLAADRLVESYKRTKAFKETMGKAVEEAVHE